VPRTAAWNLHFVTDLKMRADDPVLLAAVPEITDRHRAAVGRPFFVDDHGTLHSALNRFFSGARMRTRSEGTNRKYAHSLLIWINFLRRQGIDWQDVTEDDLLDFKFWRRTDPRNPRPIAGSTWSVDLAAMSSFYEWAARHLDGPSLGFEVAGSVAWGSQRVSRTGISPDYRPSTVRKADVKWLSPGAFRLWRDLGVHGLTREGKERTRWRPRSQSRDAAFVEGLYSTGLRLQELSSVLVSELAILREGQRFGTQRLAAACAKTSRSRAYWIGREAVDAIALYRETERADAVRKAQRMGAYDRLDGVTIVDSAPSGYARMRGREAGAARVVPLHDIRPRERLRLFIETPEGLEPAQLWLNEDGTPRAKRAWYPAFGRANARVAKAGVENLHCEPHMLRHSFALRWYAVARLIWERRWGSEGAERAKDFREQFGDAWSFVQTMLGHADVNTTRAIYLEPFRSLDVRALLEYGRADLDPELLLQVLRDDSRVRLISDDERREAVR